MLIDRPQVVEGSVIVNATVPSGTSFPSLPNEGEMFFRTDLGSLQTFNGSVWAEAGASAVQSHAADTSMHLSSVQNNLLDGLASTLSAAELNFVDGVTSPIQTQFTSVTTSLSSHLSDDARHLSAAQNTWIDAITATATEVNYLVSVTSPIQAQINSTNSTIGGHSTRLTNLETTTVPAVQTSLNNHIADTTLHLSSAQNTWIDAITVSAAEVNRLTGVASLSSSVKDSLEALAGNHFGTKISANGSIPMAGNLALGGNRITGLGAPVALTDAATKSYVDTFAQGLHWVSSVKAASTGHLILSGLQTVDGISLTTSSRILVKDQNSPAENGIYLVSSGAWTRADDFNGIGPAGNADAFEINNAAVFVLEGGLTQSKSTWVQTSTVNTIGVDPITWTAFSGPVVNSAGPGIILGAGGLVSAKEGAGIAFDGNNAMIVDLYVGGGLMLTTNNTSSATPTTTAASVALEPTGVSPGTYGSGSQVPSFTIDSKGRVTSASTSAVSASFTSLTNKPTTLDGYGITDALPKIGGSLTGNLSIYPIAGPANLSITRASSGAGEVTVNLITDAGGDAGTWKLRNQAGTSDLSLYSSALGNNVMRMTIAGGTFFSGNVTAPTFTGALTGNASSASASGYAQVLAQSDGVEYTVPTNPIPTSGSRSTILPPNAYAFGLFSEFKSSGPLGAPGNFSGLLTYANFTSTSASTGDPSYQVLFSPSAPNSTSNPELRLRAGIDTTWGAWLNILTSANFNTFAPTKTGAGASGTWPISVSGSAASVGGYAPSVPGTPDTLVARNSSGDVAARYFSSTDNGVLSGVTGVVVKAGDNNLRTGTAAGAAAFIGPAITSLGEIKTIQNITVPVGIIRMIPDLMLNGGAGSAVILNWDNGTTGSTRTVRIGNGLSSGSTDVWYCQANGVTSQTGSLTAASLNTGGAVSSSGGVFVAANGTSNDPYGAVSVVQPANSTNYSYFGLTRFGVIGWNQGIDTANQMFWGNGTPGFTANVTNRVMTLSTTGTLTCSQDIVAFSDRKLKTDIEPISDALQKVKELNGVTFKRTDTGERGTGLIAQDVQAVLAEAVHESPDGTLGVAYGNLAGLFVEAIKALSTEIAELRGELKALKESQSSSSSSPSSSSTG